MKIVWQIRRIFDGIGVEMTTDVFEKIWEQASSRHPAGLVKTKQIFILVCFTCNKNLWNSYHNL